MDEKPLQLLKETRPPGPPRPGQPAQVDYQYERNGTAHIFMFTEPLQGRRHGQVREPRPAVDWASEIQGLLVQVPTRK
jgi:hypothetical protein